MRILVGKGSCGLAAGAGKVWDALKEALAKEEIGAELVTTGCVGSCYLEPLVDVIDDQGNRTTYVKVAPAMVADIIKTHVLGGDVVAEFAISDEDKARLTKQTRIALRHCGHIDPENIEEYIAQGGYRAIENCVKGKTPAEVIDVIKTSGLKGRGGAGFPTWFKWNAALQAPGEEKYIVVNADEGDPGAFMDRSILEGDPHNLLEGLMIGGYAIGAQEGLIYVRAEYPLAIARLEQAITQAREHGFLGANILDSGFSFDIRIKAGAGAFVCGEETALIASLEGKRGMPRLKPPFPAQKGYWQKPTNINNVETYANVPWIISNGGESFAAMGSEGSKGTKVFALAGKIKHGGLVEIPMGSPIRYVIEEVGGGVRDDAACKAVQMGGPSGGCIPQSLMDTPVTYEDLAKTGAIMGSGGMVVMDENTCMVDMARYFLDFIKKESCGKCNYCRIGTTRMLEILTRITEGLGRDGDIELLEELSRKISEGSLCGLGQTAPNPVLTTLRYFRHEYEDHIYRKKCAAKSCRPLLTYTVIAENCTGCGRCKKNCPVAAISGERKEIHEIAQEICIKCGKCFTSCKFKAIGVE